MLLEEAAGHYERAIHIDSTQVGAQRRLALMAADRAEFTVAWEHARVALEADARSLTTRKAAGLVATWAGNLELGKALLLPVPGIVNELTVWSHSWEERGQLVAARNSLRAAAAIGPQPVEAKERLTDLERRTAAP
jgi:hypothetical protein